MNRGLSRRYFPVPLVAVAILLILLILLTPVLLSNGQPAPGSIEAEAELVVDYVAGDSVVHYYVHALGASVRYAEIRMAVASGFVWDGSFPSPASLNWSLAVNQTNVLAAILTTGANPLALNVTVLYSVSSGSAYYVGEFAFYLSPPGSGGQSLNAVTVTSGVAVTASQSVGSLPEFIVLAQVSGP